MEINYLKEFIVLAETLNFAEASDRLYTTQSTLSKHIRKLEDELGYLLFDRTTRKVSLSELGAEFLGYAQKIVDVHEEYLMNFSRKSDTEIIIGTIPSMFEYNITDIIVKFREKTGINIKIIQASSDRLEDMLRNGKCHFAFIKQTEDPEGEFVRIPYTSDTLIAVLPRKHSLSKRKNIHIHELKNESFLLQPENSRPYNLCIEACQRDGVNPNIIFTDSQLSNIIDLVSKGMGVSLLMKKLVPPAHKDIIAVNIIPEITASVELCFSKRHILHKKAEFFLNYFKKIIKT